ncbi:menaquinone biosynthesis protein, SCO4550 family [Archaeoglobus sulfaticallidus PM70-1]|uniref:Cyclic dehypoxanthine futalosine synthase n=1 Tax=Archaeoglobus sulfaticallidus PM70-1 TaxID=387631 RepID=N0BD67_9EURY|nr:cyclic dehypoxanthinyl futalosine synthase [Archaeoglobus sulfaticallidus]AGK60187.1 menaquinone biosynthesis protein, SCO4550 family [Archaeoglobus sulfaticallidus PM70-1]
MRLEFDEALELFDIPIYELGKMADEIRKERCGDVVTFVIDTNINYTNICVSKCKFCAFYRDDGFVLSYDDILDRISDAVKHGVTQVMLQGGMNPDLGIEWFEGLFRLIKSKFQNIHLHSLSPPEIVFLSELEGLSYREVLEKLKNAGLDSLPGGGAEILSDRVRRKLSPKKCSADEWIEVMREAHRLGMKTTATMMFGHVESHEDIVEHLFRVRDLQDETGGFTAFIPWTYQPGNNELTSTIKEPASFTHYLKILAISRIVLHNIENIQASWLTQGFDVSLLALYFGANDFGGVMLEENVLRATGKKIACIKVEDMVRLLKTTGRKVAQRDTYYNILRWF